MAGFLASEPTKIGAMRNPAGTVPQRNRKSGVQNRDRRARNDPFEPLYDGRRRRRAGSNRRVQVRTARVSEKDYLETGGAERRARAGLLADRVHTDKRKATPRFTNHTMKSTPARPPFRTSSQGYHREDVDTFVLALANEHAQLQERVADLEAVLDATIQVLTARLAPRQHELDRAVPLGRQGQAVTTRINVANYTRLTGVPQRPSR